MKSLKYCFIIFFFLVSASKAEYFEAGSNGNIIELTITNPSAYFTLYDLVMSLNITETSSWIKSVEFTPEVGTIMPKGSTDKTITFNIDSETWGDETGKVVFDLTASTGDKYQISVDVGVYLFYEIFKDYEYVNSSSDPLYGYNKPVGWTLDQGSAVYPGIELYDPTSNSMILGNYGYIPLTMIDNPTVYINEFGLLSTNRSQDIPVLQANVILNETIEIEQQKNDYNAELSVWVGLPKFLGATEYYCYQSDFKLYIDKGNGWQLAIIPSREFHLENSPKPGDSDYYDWVYSAPFGFIEYRQDLGKVSNLKFMITTNSYKEEYNDLEEIYFDNISVRYLKDRILGNPPTNLIAQKGLDGATMTLNWSAPTGSKNITPSYYKVFKNGNLLADNIAGMSYTDNNNSLGQTIEYSVSAVYDGIYPSSILDCWLKVQTDEWKAPSPLNFNLTQHSGIEYCNIDIAWDSALPIVQDNYYLSGYYVYRDNVKTDSLPADVTDYTDFLVPDGIHSYFITSCYDSIYESIPTNTLNASEIISPEYVPDTVENFEHLGEYPTDWASSITSDSLYPKWQIYNESDNYYTCIGALYNETTGISIETANKYNKLRTPKYDLLSYQDAKISFDYKALGLTDGFTQSYLIIKHYNQGKDVLDTLAVIEENSPTWNHIEISVDYGIVSSESFFIFEYKQETNNESYSFNSQVSIDNVTITGDYLNPPINLTAKLESDQTVKLIWEEPIIPLNLTGYNVYRNNILISTIQENNHSYTDYDLLDPGSYEYAVTAIYSPYNNESISIKATINKQEVYLLPFSENFEKLGVMPDNWSAFYQDVPPPAWEFVPSNYNGTILPSEGDCFAYLASIGWAYSSSRTLISPQLNLSLYSDIKLKFKENLNANEGTSNLNVYLFDDENVTYQNIHIQSNGSAIGWQNIEIPILSLSSSCHIEFEVELKTYDRVGSYAEICLDAVEVTGTANIPAPNNIQIVNNQGFISLTWDPVQNASKYHIYRSEYPDKSFEEIAVVENEGYSDVIRIDNRVSPSVDTFKKAYYYKIAAEVGLLQRALRHGK